MMGEKSLFVEVQCMYGVCCKEPPYGKFTIGREYPFEYIIDGECVVDDLQEKIIFAEEMFKECFSKLEKVVSEHSPILEDNTIYSIYLVLNGEICNVWEIRAYAKIKNVNYLEAKKMLKQKRSLIAYGNAYQIMQIIKKLTNFKVNYEIEPPYIW